MGAIAWYPGPFDDGSKSKAGEEAQRSQRPANFILEARVRTGWLTQQDAFKNR